MAAEGREPGPVARIGLVAGDGFAMAGMHEDARHEPCEDVADRLAGPPRALARHVGTPCLDSPS